jgi:hypothetical protein
MPLQYETYIVANAPVCRLTISNVLEIIFPGSEFLLLSCWTFESNILPERSTEKLTILKASTMIDFDKFFLKCQLKI